MVERGQQELEEKNGVVVVVDRTRSNLISYFKKSLPPSSNKIRHPDYNHNYHSNDW